MTESVTPQHIAIMKQVVAMAHHNRTVQHGRPFAAVVTDDAGNILGQGLNTMMVSHDMTAHAELEAIRDFCRQRQQLSIEGLTVYASGHPCPMCLGALVAGKVRQVFYAFDNQDAEPYGLSTEGTYQRLGLRLQPQPVPLTRIDTGLRAEHLYGDTPWPEA